MERFVVLRTVFQLHEAHHITKKLELENIDAMTEHITVHQGSALASGYRIFVPVESVFLAKQILGSDGERSNLSAH